LLPGTFRRGLHVVLSDSGEIRKQRNERGRKLSRDGCGIHEASLCLVVDGDRPSRAVSTVMPS
jgi:hypothetical protein